MSTATRDEQRAALIVAYDQLGPRAAAILGEVARRLVFGTRFGDFDPSVWPPGRHEREAAEEGVDMLVYLLARLLPVAASPSDAEPLSTAIRVRVIEIAPFDRTPSHDVGEVVDLPPETLGDEHEGWRLLLRSSAAHDRRMATAPRHGVGTYCKVEILS